MHLLGWLDDLMVRFLLNLPTSELSTVQRICFQLEEAHWFYEDFVRPDEANAGNNLPHMTLKEFCLAMFAHCPFTNCFTPAQHLAAYEAFLEYKARVPVRGAIMLDEAMERVVLVRGWKKGANWSFPRGKINKGERDLDCAIRETWEETGFNLRAAGFAPEDDSKADIFECTMHEQHTRFYVFRGIPLDTKFETLTRKEISKIQWFNLRDLPGFTKRKDADQEADDDAPNANKFYMVAPFVGPIKKYIALNKRKRADNIHSDAQLEQPIHLEEESIVAPAALAEVHSQELKNLLNVGPSTSTGDDSKPQSQHSEQTAQVRSLPEAQYERRLDLQHLFATPGHPQLQHAQQHYHGQSPLPFGQPMHHPEPPGFQHYPNSNMISAQPFQQHSAVPMHQSAAMLEPGFMPQHQRLMHHTEIQTPSLPGTFYQPRQLGQQFQQEKTQERQESFGAPHSVFASNNEPSALLASSKAPELPVPNLTAHSMKLLEAFKQGIRQSANASSQQPVQSANAHQSKLLDLFKSPVQTSVGLDKPVSQPSTNETAINERLQTASSIKPAPQTKSSPEQQSAAAVPESHSRSLSKSRPPPERKATACTRRNGSRVRLESPAPIATQQSPHTPSHHKRAQNRSDATTHKQSKNAPAIIPSFTILTRPGSAKENSSQTLLQPQILQRSPPSSSEPGPSIKTPATKVNQQLDQVNPIQINIDSPTDKTEQQKKLLTLLGGPLTASQSGPANATTMPLVTTLPAPMDIAKEKQEQDSLPLSSKSKTMPNLAADIVVNGGSKIPMQPARQQQQPKVTMLRRSPIGHNGNLGEPRADIPVTSPAPDRAHQDGLLSLFGSGAKVERKSSTSATPTEAKNFLLGFLNDVVQKEGRTT